MDFPQKNTCLYYLLSYAAIALKACISNIKVAIAYGIKVSLMKDGLMQAKFPKPPLEL